MTHSIYIYKGSGQILNDSIGFLNFTDLEVFHQNRAKSDNRSVDSVRNQDFFNAGLSPYPHTTTSQEHQIGHPPGFLLCMQDKQDIDKILTTIEIST